MAFTNNPSNGEDDQEVRITDFPREVEAGNQITIPFEIDTGNVTDPQDLAVTVTAKFFYSGTNEEAHKRTKGAAVTENTTVADSFTWVTKTNEELSGTSSPESGYPPGEVPDNSDYPRTVKNIFVQAILEYENGDTTTIDTLIDSDDDEKRELSITAPIDEPGLAEFPEQDQVIGGEDVLSDTFDRTDFYIKNIAYEDGATFIDSNFDVRKDEVTRNDADELRYRITFDEDFGNPSVAIDASGRFAKHEIIGGTTVRQKVGEDPLNVAINGVCTERTANQIDTLRDASSGVIIGPRMPGSAGSDNSGSLRVQFGSTSTEPLEDGGAAMFSGDSAGELLYSYSINAIEVIR